MIFSNIAECDSQTSWQSSSIACHKYFLPKANIIKCTYKTFKQNSVIPYDAVSVSTVTSQNAIIKQINSQSRQSIKYAS